MMQLNGLTQPLSLSLPCARKRLHDYIDLKFTREEKCALITFADDMEKNR